MRFHALLCVLPPCTSSLLWAGRIRGLTLSPVSLCSLPASSCTHLDRPHGLSFRLSVLPMRTAIVLFPRCEPSVPLSRFDPSSRHGTPLPHPTPPLWQSGATNGHQVAPGHHMPTGSGPPPLPCLPDLPLPVEHTHIAVPCHFASSPSRLPPIKRRGRKAGASLPPVSAAVTAHHKSCPRCT